MLRASHLPPGASPALGLLRLALVPSLSFTSPSKLTPLSFSLPIRTFLSKPYLLTSSNYSSRSPPLAPTMFSNPRQRGTGLSASLSTEASSGNEREILVQHLLVKENDAKLLVELLKRVSSGKEDLSDLAVEYSICPSKQEGGMLGWVRKGQMVPEFEEAAFSAPLNRVVKCKTQFGWHLLQVLSEREEAVLVELPPEEFHMKLQDPEFMEHAQLIDVREPSEVATSSLPGFQVFPLRQFGSWAPEINTKLDPQKDTYVMCHHGMRSLQVAKWLQTQGFRKVYNLSGGIHAYAVKVDPSIPTY